MGTPHHGEVQGCDTSCLFPLRTRVTGCGTPHLRHLHHRVPFPLGRTWSPRNCRSAGHEGSQSESFLPPMSAGFRGGGAQPHWGASPDPHTLLSPAPQGFSGLDGAKGEPGPAGPKVRSGGSITLAIPVQSHCCSLPLEQGSRSFNVVLSPRVSLAAQGRMELLGRW